MPRLGSVLVCNKKRSDDVARMDFGHGMGVNTAQEAFLAGKLKVRFRITRKKRSIVTQIGRLVAYRPTTSKKRSIDTRGQQKQTNVPPLQNLRRRRTSSSTICRQSQRHNNHAATHGNQRRRQDGPQAAAHHHPQQQRRPRHRVRDLRRQRMAIVSAQSRPRAKSRTHCPSVVPMRPRRPKTNPPTSTTCWPRTSN